MAITWFRARTTGEDGCHPDEAQALQSYLNHNTTPRDAAHAITQPVSSVDDPGESVCRLWGLLQDALLELPATHIPALIKLLRAIEDLPDPKLTSISPEKPPRRAPFTWKGLPTFGHMWADTYKQVDWRITLAETLTSIPDFRERLKKRQELRTTHIRIANIEARFVMANVADFPLDWGYETIADALELDTAVLDFEIPAASTWIEVAGAELSKGARERRKSWPLKRQRNMAREDEKMSMSRWTFWEERMEEYRERGEIITNAAKEAKEGMKKVMESQDKASA